MTDMNNLDGSIGNYGCEWMSCCQKNGLAYRSKHDVNRLIKDIKRFRRAVRLENLFLHECDSHYVLSTSELCLVC